MNFQSAEFLLLLTAVFTLYWALHRFSFRWQNIVLVAASYVFYGYVHPWLLILLASYTAIAFAAAIGIERSPHRKRVILTVVLMFALGGLGVFKYFNFFAQNFADVASLVGIRDAEWSLKIFLPLGISFYAFEVLSYVFDVYRGRQRATRNLLDFALFVSFFPHLVAGPIQRAGNLLT